MQAFTATIAISTNLSDAVTLGALKPRAISMPVGWDAASLTFQSSPDGITWQNVYDDAGTEYSITADASYYILLNPADFASLTKLKVRSGSSGSPVTQTAERLITILAEDA